MCPYCQEKQTIVKRGRYVRPSDHVSLQRYYCKDCKKSFSESYFGIEYRLRKRRINQAVFRTLCSGVSQRACAFLLGVDRETIARRIVLFGRCAAHNLAVYRSTVEPKSDVQFDEMISFEHTKCKPLTLPIAVENKTRKILAVAVGRIPANGHLAAISRKKYGPRPCERKGTMHRLFDDFSQCLAPRGMIRSDQSKLYPSIVKKFLPHWQYEAFKGMRGCVVGLGELKATTFDPLFSLNHTYAMIRDGLKRLSRRTWCVTKRPDRLEMLLNIYAWFHNLKLDSKNRANIRLFWLSSTN